MLNRFARATVGRLLTPVAAFLVRRGVAPDAVTLLGTLCVCLSALVFYPRGEFWWGSVLIGIFAFSDTLDGLMARMSNRSCKWGAFWDSTLDRFADAAIFGGVVLYYAYGTSARDSTMMAAALACLVLGSIVPYARARAEGLGLHAAVGIAERADRLVVILVAVGFVGLYWKIGFGFPEWVLLVVLIALAIASAITIVQRMWTVWQQTRDEADALKAVP